jgi:hypothetical protein
MDTKKFHLIKWGTIIAPYEHGGVAIIDPAMINKALGAKKL